MTQTPQKSIDQLDSFGEQRKFIEAISVYPALTVMIFIRQKVGFRMLKPTWLTMLTIILVAIPEIFSGVARPFGFVMVLFALAMCGYGHFQRYQRWCDICRGERWHTYSPGVSYLEKLPLPPFFRANRRVNRYLDPVLCLLIAIVATFLCVSLGAWLAVSALALAIYENALFERMLERNLDTLDGLIEAEVQQETVKFFEQPSPEQKQRALEETAGIPTGIAPDIAQQVEVRRARRHAAPDNIMKDEVAPEGAA